MKGAEKLASNKGHRRDLKQRSRNQVARPVKPQRHEERRDEVIRISALFVSLRFSWPAFLAGHEFGFRMDRF